MLKVLYVLFFYLQVFYMLCTNILVYVKFFLLDSDACNSTLLTMLEILKFKAYLCFLAAGSGSNHFI